MVTVYINEEFKKIQQKEHGLASGNMSDKMIVGWEVWKRKDAEHASKLIKRIYRDGKVHMKKKPLKP